MLLSPSSGPYNRKFQPLKQGKRTRSVLEAGSDRDKSAPASAFSSSDKSCDKTVNGRLSNTKNEDPIAKSVTSDPELSESESESETESESESEDDHLKSGVEDASDSGTDLNPIIQALLLHPTREIQAQLAHQALIVHQNTQIQALFADQALEMHQNQTPIQLWKNSLVELAIYL